jgi:hypothetical protein
MPESHVELFAQLLCELVRDQAIRNCSARLNPNTRSPIGKQWHVAIQGADPKQISDVIIPDCVDEAIFCLLNAIDDAGVRLKFVGAEGAEIDLTDDGLGEMAGWYAGDDSWREKFSKERVNNY